MQLASGTGVKASVAHSTLLACFFFPIVTSLGHSWEIPMLLNHDVPTPWEQGARFTQHQLYWCEHATGGEDDLDLDSESEDG